MFDHSPHYSRYFHFFLQAAVQQHHAALTDERGRYAVEKASMRRRDDNAARELARCRHAQVAATHRTKNLTFQIGVLGDQLVATQARAANAEARAMGLQATCHAGLVTSHTGGMPDCCSTPTCAHDCGYESDALPKSVPVHKKKKQKSFESMRGGDGSGNCFSDDIMSAEEPHMRALQKKVAAVEVC
jgi:hypothetical protein